MTGRALLGQAIVVVAASCARPAAPPPNETPNEIVSPAVVSASARASSVRADPPTCRPSRSTRLAAGT